MSNARHQEAIATRDDLVLQLREDITDTLTVLSQLAGLLEDLADTRQSIAIGIVTAEAATARAKSDAIDRAAARGQLHRNTTPGLGWMNAAAGASTGQIPAPVTMNAVSVLAEIRFALQQHISRLGRPAAAAVRMVAQAEAERQYCTWPRHPAAAYLQSTSVDVDCPLGDLFDRLQVLCSSYLNRPGLAAILRDLEHLEATARDVVDGPARTPHPEPCPWCDTKSLVVHHRGEGHAATIIRCEGDHPCRCDFEHCMCHRNPRRNRHEWVNSGGAAHTWHNLRNLQNKRKEIRAMETKALDAVTQIEAIHRPTWLFEDGSEEPAFTMAPAGVEIPLDHECTPDCGPQGPDDDHAEMWHAVPICTTCCTWTPGGDLAHALYPCPTVQAIQAADLNFPDRGTAAPTSKES